jgi:DnaJ-class molecular chaperone
MTDTPTLKDLLTVPCGTCDGSGKAAMPNVPWGREKCPDCGGRGWEPAEGIGLTHQHGTDYKELRVPLSMLEVT